ncbi:hypothetical protein [Paenibacillus sp. VTT E-133291]|uniref:hypothetical protein n=1 Tax=Paenibacillus sp. VTT E-133291 TaxID=1986223 RepID=UPI000B9FE3BE|nr:hypothetical protein [Paenibacillus sp. VTT E-133291]OZQ81176.1 hypothetical protein CA598_27045 [Paenibacillus sp. VTT E-133291]
MRETDLFEPVKYWLEEREWDVYAEVTGVGGRADIVGRHGMAVLNVELKVQLSFELLSQAVDRKAYFHYVYIGIPKRKTPIPRIARDLLNREGIGLLEIQNDFVSMSLPGRFNRPAPYHNIKWDSVLRPEYKLHVGGDNGPHIQTPYKLLMNGIRNHLISVRDADNLRSVHGGFRNYGWIEIQEILDHCEAHRHYAAPKSSVSNALRSFEMNWCEVKKEGGKLFYRAKEDIQRQMNP